MRSLAPLLLIACSAPSQPAQPIPKPLPRTTALDAAQPAAAPKLVVLLIVDQLPQWAFRHKRPHLTRGFDRLLREGEWHTGEHPSAATTTAPGHALLGTGKPTAQTGILGNEWWHRETGRVVRAAEGVDGTLGPHHLRVPALGDALAAANTGGKAVSVSLKERASILTLGRAGLPIWYDKKAVALTTTTPPAWLAEHARQQPIKPRLDEAWTPLDATKLARLTNTTDDARGEVGAKGFGPTFPHAAKQLKNAGDAVFATPLGNEVVLEGALAAIDGEQLGADAAPDLLVVSLSAHDYALHGWGHESWEAWDMLLRLDEQLARFLDGLDARVGKHAWAMIVTSDHGGAPMPEATGRGGRITSDQIRDAANRAAVTQLGPGTWIANAKYPSVFLTPAALAHKSRDKAILKIILALESFPGIELAARTVDYAGACDAQTGDRAAICNALDRERSGEVFYVPKRGWMIVEADEPVATAHGSLHDYDREVPVILLAPGRVAHAPLAAPSTTTIHMTRIAAALARWLGVNAP